MTNHNHLLHLTAEDIRDLDDSQLRNLVGYLCEEELREQGFSPSAVTYGGDQDAPDGGVDVRLDLPPGSLVSGFLSRPQIIFQVKKPSMATAKIIREMAPGNRVRSVIARLAKVSGGAYIIVSSGSNVSDSELDKRRAAMKTALKTLASKVFVDFYDQTRLATCVRKHPGLVLWVRTMVGRPLKGWRPYEPWAYRQKVKDEGYQQCSLKSVFADASMDSNGMTRLEAVQRIRSALSGDSRAIRVVGLSGVGKTRFCHAIFDKNVGENQISSHLVLYADLSDPVEPAPLDLVTQLVNEKRHAIVIVDNCPQKLHRKLTELVGGDATNVKVLTVEYDIREDLSEDTSVFELVSPEPEVAQKLVNLHYPILSSTTCSAIAELAAGNPRLALSLAAQAKQTDTFAVLKSDEFFLRLFQQRNQPDANLLMAAEVCSLVYSFNTEIDSDGVNEIAILASLISADEKLMFRSVAELMRRQLIQCRANWRAVLPHALANKLAGKALQNIRASEITSTFHFGESGGRLMQSFSRRIGYLHTSMEAIAIAESWLGPGGALYNLLDLPDRLWEVVRNIAPAVPSAVLSRIEEACNTADGASQLSEKREMASLLRSLAFDAAFFDRSVAVMVIMLSGEAQHEERNLSSELASLFYLYGSGTHAPILQRLRFIRKLLASDQESLALRLLKATLESSNTAPSMPHSFGGRSRDYGFWPKTSEEVREWFRAVTDLIRQLLEDGGPTFEPVKNALAGKLPNLLLYGGILPELRNILGKLSKNRFFKEAWLAVRECLKYESYRMETDLLSALQELDAVLRPRSLVDKTNALVTNEVDGHEAWELYEDDRENADVAYARATRAALELGQAVASQPDLLPQLLPGLFSSFGLARAFGRGLASEANDLNGLLETLLAGLVKRASPPATCFLCGCLEALAERSELIAEQFLEAFLAEPLTLSVFPELQFSLPVSPTGIERLRGLLDAQKPSASRYSSLWLWGAQSGAIPADSFTDLLSRLMKLTDGISIVLKILAMRLHQEKARCVPMHLSYIIFGRELLEALIPVQTDDSDDHRMAELASLCLQSSDGDTAVRKLCSQIVSNFKTTRGSFREQKKGRFIATLISQYSVPVLDVLFDEHRITGMQIVDRLFWSRPNPLDSVDGYIMLEWCADGGQSRYETAAEVLSFKIKNQSSDAPIWNPTLLQLMELAPSPERVLAVLLRRLTPRFFSGTHSQALKSRLERLEELAPLLSLTHQSVIRNEQNKVQVELHQAIEKEQQKSAKRQTYASFE